MKNQTYRYYDLILAFFAACLLISNLAATKLVTIGPFPLDGGFVLFPIVYIFADVLTEVYGYTYARRAIWTGFAVMLLATASLTIVRYLPPSPDYMHQAAFEAVHGFFPQIVAASLLAYLVGEFLNSYVLARLKVKMKGRKMWFRLIGSTILGGFADTVVFALVAFSGVFSGNEMLKFIAVGWAFKIIVEVVFLPVTYQAIRFLKKREGVDAYDKKTDFTPAKVSL